MEGSTPSTAAAAPSSSAAAALAASTPASSSARSNGRLHGQVFAWEVQVMRITTGDCIEAFDVSSQFFTDHRRAVAFAHQQAREIHEQGDIDMRDEDGDGEEGEFEESDDGCYRVLDTSNNVPALSITVKPTTINFDAADGIILRTNAEEST